MAIYESDIYKSINKQIVDFKDYKLLQDVCSNPVPSHLAIIMDGNRRYAAERGMDTTEGHQHGTEKLEQVLEWCFDAKIKILTVYAFSTENFSRDDDEISVLMDICKEQLKRAKESSLIHQYRCRIRIIGHIDSLPRSLREAAEEVESSTKDYEDYNFNIALAYGGREEIVQAIKQISTEVCDGDIDVEDITESTVSDHLYTIGLPDPDLILRTSGESRISNFLLWQHAYSELYFTDIFWPAFKKHDFLKAIQDYQRRKRRYGI